jgi:hypothetical protein
MVSMTICNIQDLARGQCIVNESVEGKDSREGFRVCEVEAEGIWQVPWSVVCLLVELVVDNV